MNSSFFTTNRQRLSDALDEGLIVLTGFTGMQWHGDSAIPFRQEANFWYLTGIEYADWRLVIDGKQGKTWLVAPEVDTTHELFDGSLSLERAKKLSGIDEIVGSEAGSRLLEDLAKTHRVVHTLGTPPYAEYSNFVLNPAASTLCKELSRQFAKIKDCRKELSRLRAVKRPEEIAIMERAAELSVEAFELAKSSLGQCAYEYEVEAEFAYHFRRNNAMHAFEPIVASGKNACTLHYVANTARLEKGQLLLIDTGASFRGYPADITRTYAVGELTERHVAVHQAVQAAERRIIECIKPGLALKSYLETTDTIMKEALMSLGLIESAKDQQAYRRYFPHAVSHGLGLDVHESLGGYEELRSGMVLTVEPGIYIPEEGIGVRIEDDILVTETGHKNLTAALSTDL